MVGNKLTPLYEKGIKQTQNKPMETTWLSQKINYMCRLSMTGLHNSKTINLPSVFEKLFYSLAKSW